jgi:serine/threonine protein kinase
MADPTPNLIGGRYEIITPLGKGGMGIVYKAYDPVLDRTVAIKKMAANIVDHDEFRQRFFVEARAVARLNHPNIVTIHELEEDEGGIYIVMEMLDGVSLSAVMKHGDTLSRDAQVTLLAKVCSGLDYAHVRGVIHRDIKPANLMLTTTGGVKILDFGIARFASSEMTSLGGSMLGTPHYMSPEQIEGKPVDARADWFSFGAVAYELIARMKPFDAPSVPPLLMKITNTPHVPLIDVAPDTVPPLSAIVDRLLAKDRDQRPPSGADVQCALNASGDTNREDLIAAAVRNVLGDAGDVTLIQPMSTRGTTAPLVAAKPSAPIAIPGGTSTTPLTMRPTTPLPGDAPGGSTVTQLSPMSSTSAMAPPTVGLPRNIAPIAASPAVPPSVPVQTGTVPVASTTGATVPVEIGAVSTAVPTAVPTAPIQAPPPAPVAAPAPPAPVTPVAVSRPVASDIPVARKSLPGTLLIVGLMLLVIGIVGAGGVWWFLSYTDTGRFALNSLLGRKPVATSADATPSSSSSPTSTQTPSASTPSSSSPIDSATQPTQPSTSPTGQPPTGDTPGQTPNGQTPGGQTLPSTSTSAPSSTVATAPGATPPGATAPGATAPGATKPAGDSTASTPGTGAPLPSMPGSTPEPPRVVDASPRPTPGEPRTPAPPRTDGPRRSATPAEPLPPERGPAPPPPPADDTPRVASHGDTRAPLDQATVDAFKGTRGSSAPSGYGNIDSPLNAASVVRIKDTLESYSQAIEHQDLDALRAVRESLTAAESAQAQSASPTLVHFSEVDVRTDGKTAAVRARRAITVGGAAKANGYVEIRLARRPAGWVITDIR